MLVMGQRTRITTGSIAAAMPDLAMGAFCLITWIAPTLFSARALAWVVLAAVFEFIVIHSSAMLGHEALKPGERTQKIIRCLGLTLFYTIFAGGFSLAFKTWWPLFSFWGLSLNRLLSIIINARTTENEEDVLKAGWAAQAMFYLGFVFLTLFFPLPRLGITKEVIAMQNFTGTGAWIEQPHRAVAMCFLYFTSVGLFELLSLHGLLIPKQSPAASVQKL